MTEVSNRTVVESREAVDRIVRGKDSRLLAIVGPCSIHDPVAAMDYARRLGDLRKRIEDRIYVVMRVYFEKPRTTLGWRGMIFDPGMNGSGDIARGLKEGRKLLLEITSLGLPAGSEVLDPDRPPVHHGPHVLGLHRRPDHREPAPPGNGEPAFPCPWASRTAPTAASRTANQRHDEFPASAQLHRYRR